MLDLSIYVYRYFKGPIICSMGWYIVRLSDRQKIDRYLDIFL